MSRGPDAATLLERRLLLAAQAGGQDLVVSDVQSVPWASATFNGARHRVTAQAAASPGLDAWLQCLPEAELPLRGHLVADLTVLFAAAEGDRLRVEIEVLTVEDR
ncbi:hypothetical protein LK533_02485 [Sphingomonas sp. PL-96]|uniref:hypothetical protein n=1 Tax=Sphingomonas sp. PL-96 TaxID=2887201 RepID=UPI001E511D86|nr:hypothetical protein [Sphingomonas sp. PL-96]MCC2975541.1 hypothetical protein [Sphingomonas sp. PL-96]